MNKIDFQYQNILQDILDNGVEKDTRNGKTLSVFGWQIRHDMSDGFPLLTTKKVPFKTMVTELTWFLKGRTDIQYLWDRECHIWDGDVYKSYLQKVIRDKDIVRYVKSYSIDTEGVPTIELYSKDEFIKRIKNDDDFAKKWGELGPIYGKQWRYWERYPADPKPVDQLRNLINELKTNPDSRRLMVSAWNVSELDEMTLPPCHYGFQCYVSEGKLSLLWNQRSVDVPLGLPFNIASYGLLLEILAKEVGMIPGELIGNLGDTHIYQNQKEGVIDQLGRIPYDELPKVQFDKKPFDEYEPEDFELIGYKSHPTIKFPLSN